MLSAICIVRIVSAEEILTMVVSDRAFKSFDDNRPRRDGKFQFDRSR